MSQYYQSTVSKLLHDSLLKLCSENVPYDSHLEIDGIICISTGNEHDQIVVKVHEIVENVQATVWPEEPVDLTTDEVTVQENRSEIYDLSKEPKWKVPGSENDGIEHIERDEEVGHNFMKSRHLEHCEERVEHDQAPSLNLRTKSDTEDELCHLDIELNELKKASGASAILPSQEIVPPSKRRQGRQRVLPTHELASKPAYAEVTCRYCSQTFLGYSSLVNHNYEIHNRYSCRHCLNTFSLQCNLRRHERLHVGSKPFVCGVCEKTFSRNGDLKIHELKHRVDNDLCNVQCRKCNQLFMSRVAYKEHYCKTKGKRHKKPKTLDSIFGSPCRSHIQENGLPPDDQGTTDEGNAGPEKKDQDSHEPLIKFEETASLMMANGHVSASKPESPASFAPNLSEAENKYANFSSMDFLSFVALQIDAHENSLKQMNTEEAQAKCPENSYLTSHTSNHNQDFSSPISGISPQAKQKAGESPEAHNVKPETFKKSNKTAENLEPSEEKVYLCKMCKTHWNGFRAYDEHFQKRHLRYPCHLCDQTFTNKNNRSRHVRNHMGQRVYNCTECGKSFSRSDTLKEHQIIHTEGYIGDKCHYCGLNIKKKAELLSHIKKCARINKSF